MNVTSAQATPQNPRVLDHCVCRITFVQKILDSQQLQHANQTAKPASPCQFQPRSVRYMTRKLGKNCQLMQRFYDQ